MAQLRLNQISKSFGKTQVIREVDLCVENGEFVVFVGPSGCGKSTLLRLVAGLESISDGQLLIGGRHVNDLPPRERGVGMVFQSYALYPHMSVYDNMAFGLKLAKAEQTTVAQRVADTARVLQIEHLLERKPAELSGGQRQRVAMGRAMAREPDILLFDEPLSNLDASLRVQMRNEIARLHRRLGATVIYVTHDQVEAMTLADKIVILNAGRIEQVGSPRELYQRPATRFVAGFIGSPTMNFIDVTLESIDADGARVHDARLGSLKVCHAAERHRVGDRLTLGIRPQYLTLGEPSGDNRFEVINVEYLGNEVYVYLDTGQADAPLVVRANADASWAIGDQVGVTLENDYIHLFDDQGQALPREGQRRAA